MTPEQELAEVEEGIEEHEEYIRGLDLNEKSNLGDYLENLKNCQEDVAINLLGHMLDLAKCKLKSEGLKKAIAYKDELLKDEIEFLEEFDEYCLSKNFLGGRIKIRERLRQLNSSQNKK